MSNAPAILIDYETSTRILNNPILSSQDISCLDKYYILYWEARYLSTQCVIERSSDIKVSREKVDYRVYMHAPITFEYLRKNPDHQVRLSFRRVKGKTRGIVLITQVKGEQNDTTTS